MLSLHTKSSHFTHLGSRGAPRRNGPVLPARVRCVVALLALFAATNARAAPKGRPVKAPAKEASASAPDKAGGPGPETLELVALDEMQLSHGAVKSVPARTEKVAEPPKDSLDGLLRHSTYSEPVPAAAPVKERMKFPGEKPKAEAPTAEKAEVVAPDRITSDVTAKAIAAAKPTPTKPRNMMAAAVVPKLPTKVKVNDDPLAGMAAKDMDDKTAVRKKARK